MPENIMHGNKVDKMVDFEIEKRNITDMDYFQIPKEQYNKLKVKYPKYLEKFIYDIYKRFHEGDVTERTAEAAVMSKLACDESFHVSQPHTIKHLFLALKFSMAGPSILYKDGFLEKKLENLVDRKMLEKTKDGRAYKMTPKTKAAFLYLGIDMIDGKLGEAEQS